MRRYVIFAFNLSARKHGSSDIHGTFDSLDEASNVYAGLKEHDIYDVLELFDTDTETVLLYSERAELALIA